jgi:ribosomal protein S18 acetylase RimI-like enzyme
VIEIRRAGLTDCAFIRELSVEVVGQGIPENRDIPTAEVKERCKTGLAELEQWIVRKREFAIFVAVDTEKNNERAGFIIIEFNHSEESTGEKQSYIFNLAVRPEYWGKWAGHRLVWEACKISHQRGYRYMTSKVTASNERALLSAVKMGFEIERYQLTIACGPEGRARMPGRPFAERDHAVTRMLKARKKKQSGETT